MRRKFENLRDNLHAFVEQRDAFAMVLHFKNDPDVAYPLKYLDALEKQSQSDIYIIFGGRCDEPTSYIDSFMAECEMSIDVGNAAIDEGLGDKHAEHWPGLPGACFDASLSTLERVQALLGFIRERYPSPDVRILLAFLPVEPGDSREYASAIGGLLPTDGLQPWMEGVRLLVRDSQDDPQLVPWLVEQQVPATLVYPLDFSTEALTNALVDEACDPTVPREQRMMALYQVASIDHAWNRPFDAMTKFGAAYQYFLREERDPVMQGMCLLGAAYVLQRQEQWEDAEEKFRQTLEHALDNEIEQLMLNCFIALAVLRQRVQDWAEASTFWEGACAVAKKQGNVFVLADSLEQKGICHVALNEAPMALELWAIAAELCETAQYYTRKITLLEHLIEVERREGLHDERRAHEEQLEVARRDAVVAEHKRKEQVGQLDSPEGVQA